MRSASSLFCLLGMCASALAREVPTVDFRAPVRDGAALVGIECHTRNQTLEVMAIPPGPAPGKRIDAWAARDLLVFNRTTFTLEKTLAVERSCTLGEDTFKVRLEGVAGAGNAQWQCGAFATARATVWRNGRTVFDQPLGRCGAGDDIGTVRFVPGSSAPVVRLARGPS